MCAIAEGNVEVVGRPQIQKFMFSTGSLKNLQNHNLFVSICKNTPCWNVFEWLSRILKAGVVLIMFI